MSTEPWFTLRISPGNGNRLALVHEHLRDLGLEACAHCKVWKDTAWFAPAVACPDPLTQTICTPCRDGASQAGRP